MATLELLIKGVDNASGVLKNVDKSATGLSKTVGTVLKAGALAGVAALGALAVGSIKFIGAASDLEEAVNKSRVVFGGFADRVEDFADTSAKSFGISRTAANNYAGTLGVILKGSGLTQEASAGMSIELVKLAADMASFNNIPIDVALEKIRAGLVGETEPLRTVGVLLSEAAVQEEAYASGIANTGAKLTDQQKVQARFNIIQKQTIDQQGDFARTSDSLANRQRILAAQWENIQAILGRALLPTVSRLAVAFTDFIAENEDDIERLAESLEHLSERTLPKLEAAVEDIALAIADVKEVVVPTIDAFRDLDATLDGELSKAFINSLPYLREFRQAMDLKETAEDARKDIRGFALELAMSFGPIGQAKQNWDDGQKALQLLGVTAKSSEDDLSDYTLSVDEANRLQQDLISSGEDAAGVVGDLGGAMEDTKQDIYSDFIPGLEDSIGTLEGLQSEADETRKALFAMFKEPTQEEQIAEANLANYRLELARIEQGLAPLTDAQQDYLDTLELTGDEARIAELMLGGLTRADAERVLHLDTQVIPKTERELELLKLTRDAAKEQADVKYAQKPKLDDWTRSFDDTTRALDANLLRQMDLTTQAGPLMGAIDGVRVMLGNATSAAYGYRDALFSIPSHIKTQLDIDLLKAFITADPAGVAPVPLQRQHQGTSFWRGGPLIMNNEELAVLPRGSQVLNPTQTAAALGGGGMRDVHIHFHSTYGVTPAEARRRGRDAAQALRAELGG